MAYTTINKSTAYFNTKLYTGTGSTQNITGVGFQPDWVWIKRRDSSATHTLWDAVRGTTKWLESNSTSAEQTYAGGLTAFGTDGFTIGDGGDINTNSASQVAWNWKAGGSASTNNDGSTACSLSANATAGFSVSTHTVPSGDYTIGHGLGKKPKLVFAKHTSTTGNFQTYFEGIGTANQQYLQLNTTAALANHSGLWGTGMTTSVVGLSNTALTAGTTSVVYAFAEIPGYSKFGSYTGNGSSDGIFIYTGFKPSFVMTKRTDSTSNWYMMTGKLSDYSSGDDGVNPLDRPLFANLNSGENNGDNRVDFLSNGFKFYDSGSAQNGSGATNIYMAFGQTLVGSNNVPCTAR